MNKLLIDFILQDNNSYIPLKISNRMGEQITYNADEYSGSKFFPFRLHVEKHTIFTLLGDPTGRRILDAGCGDGIYSRELADRGAAHVTGVDGAEDFIALAKQKNKGYDRKIDYHCSFIQDFSGNSDLDAIVASFILSYPRSLGEASEYCRAMASHLKEDGRFVGFNNNPFEVFSGKGGYSQYGFEKEMSGDVEGSQVTYKVDGMDNPIVNFYLRPETYEKAFRRAGFREFQWQRVLLNPAEKGNPYWNKFFMGKPPFIAMLAVK